jgi:hypothetical protein
MVDNCVQDSVLQMAAQVANGTEPDLSISSNFIDSAGYTAFTAFKSSVSLPAVHTWCVVYRTVDSYWS